VEEQVDLKQVLLMILHQEVLVVVLVEVLQYKEVLPVLLIKDLQGEMKILLHRLMELVVVEELEQLVVMVQVL
jgi:hypothetical protein